MASMLFSTVAMFTSDWVVALALAVCAAIAVISVKGYKAFLPTRKKRPDSPKEPDARLDQAESLYRAGLLTREEYLEKKRKNRRP